MNRREFLEKSCLTGLATVAGLSVLSSLDIATIKASPVIVAGGAREIPLMLQDTPDLQQVGGAYHLDIEDLDKNILVVRTGDETFLAVDIKCPHKGCDVAYENKNGEKFVCPCHGSEFKTTGEVTKGPSKKGLGAYQTKFKDGEVTIVIPDATQEGGVLEPGVDSTGKK